MPRRPGSAARDATLAIRSIPVTLRPPAGKRLNGPGDITMWAVMATETTSPPEGGGIEWLLLTTVPASTAEDALERVNWYTCRWTIEVWHRVLKTGCRIETRQLETIERLEVALTLYGIIAWRVLYATMLARLDPTLPCAILLADDEWQALYCRVKRVATPSRKPPSLADAVNWIARLGGFLARKSDGHPGPHVLWRGFQHLHHITDIFLIMRSNE